MEKEKKAQEEKENQHPDTNNDQHLKVLTDFRVFLWLTWKHLNLPAPTPVQQDIATFLQQGNDRVIIQAFRGVGKSWITSAFVCWSLLRNPQLNILVVSASKQRADDFSTFTRRLIHEMPILASLKPREGQRDANIAFDVGAARAAHAPSVKSLGITGQITGARADIIIADDVEVLNNTQTHAMREKLRNTVKEFSSVIKPGGRIIYLGTPQTEMSLYNQFGSTFTTRIWPARIPLKPETYGGKLAPFVAGHFANSVEGHHSVAGSPAKGHSGTSPVTSHPVASDPVRGRSMASHCVDPTRFDEAVLIQREAELGKTGFAMQFMLDTTLSDMDRYPLKLSDLIVMDLNPEIAPVKVAWCSSIEKALEDVPTNGLAANGSNGLVQDRFYAPLYVSDQWTEYTGSLMTIDPAGRGQDETGYCVVKMLKGQLFLTAAGGFTGGYSPETLEALAKIAKTQKVNLIQIEANFGDGMFTELFKPTLHKHHSVSIEEIRHTTQKERRIIDTLEPVMNQHRLVIDKALIRRDFDSTSDAKYKLFYQLTRITRDRGALAHDDRLESLAMAVSYWTNQMAKDTDLVEREHRDQLLEIELERFVDNALGTRPRQMVWV